MGIVTVKKESLPGHPNGPNSQPHCHLRPENRNRFPQPAVSPARATILFVLTILLLGLPRGADARKELFPTYPSIRENVRFWEKVYSHYTTRQAILHDKENLSIIYDAVELVNWETPGATRVNRKLIKLARHRYKAILSTLATGKKPATREEKRVAALFPTRSKHAYATARGRIRLQIGQKDRFMEGIIRSGAYMDAIKTIFRTHGLPMELAYLPHVESSFNPKAYSKAGAAGLWQFTRSTGRQYMTINNVIDERYDPIFATQAAAVFLKENHEELRSWPLAITAYNYGRAGMKRALREKGSYENIFNNHRTRIFKFASRNFYPEFLAAMNVAKRLEHDPRFVLDRPEATIAMRLKGYAAAGEIRKFFGIAEEDFSRLNPALRKAVLSGRKYIPKGFLLRLPATSRIRNLVGRVPSRLYHPAQVRDREYIVQRGDTAGTIARRYKISLSELIQANNLNKRAMIRVGQKLEIPGPPEAREKENIVVLRAGAKKRPR